VLAAILTTVPKKTVVLERRGPTKGVELLIGVETGGMVHAAHTIATENAARGAHDMTSLRIRANRQCVMSSRQARTTAFGLAAAWKARAPRAPMTIGP